MTMKRGPTSGWKTEQVIIAVIGGVVAIVVAVIGLVGVLGGDDQDPAGGTSPSILKTGTPQILISTTTFAARPDGSVEIGVIGTVLNFGPHDRLYAVAQPSAVTSWWVSHEVSPTLGGDWVAQIVATTQPGQQLKVFAVRIAAESYSPPDLTVGSPPPEPTQSSTGEPTQSSTGEPTSEESTPSSVPSRGSARVIEAALRARGPDARWVSGQSSRLTVAVPTQ